MSLSRRRFLGSLASGALIARSAKAGTTQHFTGHPDRRGLLHDTTLCVGCRRCEAACNQVNRLAPPLPALDSPNALAQPRGITDNLYTVVNQYQPGRLAGQAIYRKHQCMHCNEPCCASVCFVKAFVKTPEGPILYDPELCVGCRYCVLACPYYALAYEYNDPLRPRVVRCTMCYPRIKQGLNPSCADACPTGAITYGRRDTLLQLAQERMHKFPGRYLPHIFGENEYGGTSWLTLAGVPFVQLGLPDEPSAAPLPDLVTGFLSLAPLVAALYPGLLAGVFAFTKRREIISQHELRSLQLALEKAERSGLAAPKEKVP